MGLLSNKISKDELELGDHIYSWRTAYIHAHHVCRHSFPNFLVMIPGIYVGGGKVIQFTLAAGGGSGTPLDHVISSSPPSSATGNPCPRCGFHLGLDGVISSYIDCFLAGGELFLFEYDVLIPYFLAKVRGGICTILPSDSPADVLHGAHYLPEKGFRVYCLFKKNCEDFANYCKTGRILISHTNGNRIGQTVALLSMEGVDTKEAVTSSSFSPSRFFEIERKKEGADMGVLSNKISRDELKPGDHIYSWRHAHIYSHHGIYVGEGNVIHFTRGGGQEIGTGTLLDRVIFSSSPSHASSGNPCPQCGDQSRLDGVISSCIDCFLAGGDLYLFEYGVSPAFFLAKVRGGTCTLASSDSPENVIHRARYLLEKGFGVYHLFKNNCEDFAIYCKTGRIVITTISVGRSGQAASFLAAASAIVSSPLRYLTTSFSGLAAVGCGMYCVSRLVSDIGVRRDVVIVSVERLVSRSGIDETDTSNVTRED